jgi:hypothetical protein
MAADDSGRRATMSVSIRLLRLLLVATLATLSFTFWTFTDVAHACDPSVEDCEEEEEEDPPETSPPHTSPPHTNPPQTSPPRTSPPATRPPATHAPATQPAAGKTATTTATKKHTATTRRTSGQSGQSGSPTAPAEPFLDIPVAAADTGVQLPAVQLAGDAKAAPGAGAAVDAGLPPETDAGGGDADPRLALALAAAGVGLLGAPLLTRKTCDQATAAGARAEIAAACAAVATATADIERANASHAQALLAISTAHELGAAARSAHAGIDAMRATRHRELMSARRLTLGLTGGVFAGHPIDQITGSLAAADFDAALARAHADVDAQLDAAGDLSALEGARDAATADAIAAQGRHAAAAAQLRAAQARWNSTCGPVPECAS